MPASPATSDDQRGFTSRIGQTHVEVDWPRSIGFFGALGVAVALDLVSMPIALFVASVPLLKMMNKPNAPKVQRFFSHLVDGAAKPVGGDSEGTVRWADQPARGEASRTRAASRKRATTQTRSRRRPSRAVA